MNIFTRESPHKKKARVLAIGWTLLIFILCCLPGNEIPNIDIPFIDKWAHMILFGVFSFVWLCAAPSINFIHLSSVLLITVYTGWLVEYIQGNYISGRYQDNMDTLADTAGGLLGVITFYWGAFFSEKKIKKVHNNNFVFYGLLLVTEFM